MTKTDQLANELRQGWRPSPELQRKFGWEPHTLRGAISTLAKKRGLKVERTRSDGVTSYRVEGAE